MTQYPMRVPLQSPIKQLRVKRIENPYEGMVDIKSEGSWRIWLTANKDFTLGTFLQLLDNGTVQRVTWHEDGTESILEIKDDDNPNT